MPPRPVGTDRPQAQRTTPPWWNGAAAPSRSSSIPPPTSRSQRPRTWRSRRPGPVSAPIDDAAVPHSERRHRRHPCSARAPCRRPAAGVPHRNGVRPRIRAANRGALGPRGAEGPATAEAVPAARFRPRDGGAVGARVQRAGARAFRRLLAGAADLAAPRRGREAAGGAARPGGRHRGPPHVPRGHCAAGGRPRLPLTSTSANRPGGPTAPGAAAIATIFADAIDAGTLLVLDGGVLGNVPPSTLVDCTDESPAHGAGRGSSAGRAAARRRETRPVTGERPMRVVFICTGNTCRSPMAEAMMRRALAARGHQNVEVGSAGIGAWEGAPASEGSLLVGLENGLDLSQHRARLLTPDLARGADLILAMSVQQRDRAAALGAGERAHTLGEFAGVSGSVRRSAGSVWQRSRGLPVHLPAAGNPGGRGRRPDRRRPLR